MRLSVTSRDLFTKSFQDFKKNNPDILWAISYGCIKKTDHNDWGWKRNYYVMRSRDVKTKITIDHFRFEIP